MFVLYWCCFQISCLVSHVTNSFILLNILELVIYQEAKKDENEEEKAKGKTVEIGRANFDTPKKRWTIFDAPGHKNYVPNMIMGAALADYGALVISAKKGEFEAGFEGDGQTREHV